MIGAVHVPCHRLGGGRVEIEEKRKWRQDENSDGESTSSAAAAKSENDSPSTTVKTAIAANIQNSISNSSTTESVTLLLDAGMHSKIGANKESQQEQRSLELKESKRKQPVRNYYVVLAPSPPRISKDGNDSDSDRSAYDESFHERETDLCQDSTDYDSPGGDSYTTDEDMGHVDIVEYEVASTSDEVDSLAGHSSSGTDDDHGLLMATVTTLDTTSSTSDFADSEESDSDKLFDRELTEADYWQCIQCKNPQNNPLFRMCEKCYKIRRTHFPPRPKFRKKKLNRLRKRDLTSTPSRKLTYSTSLSSPSVNNAELVRRVTNDITGNDNFKAGLQSAANSSCKKRKLNYSNSSQLNSAAETSDNASSDVEHNSKEFNLAHRKRKSSFRIRQENPSTKLATGSDQSGLIVNHLENSLGRKRKSPLISDHHLLESSCVKKSRPSETKRRLSQLETASDSDNSHTTLIRMSSLQKDSGVSSAHSSQDPPNSLSDERSVEKDELINTCNQNTVSKSIILHGLGIGSHNKNNVSTTIRAVSSDLSLENQFTNSNSDNSNLIRSVSDCSNTLLNNNFTTDSFTMNMGNIDSSLSNYGSCIICLTEPKNGVFVHSKFLHLCSCYKCAVKIWSKTKRCPVCNRSVKNVKKLFVH